MLEEAVRVAKEYLGGNDIYEPCHHCHIPYGKAIEKTAVLKCVECKRMAACGRSFCAGAAKLKDDPDFSACSKCMSYSCCDCPSKCNTCQILMCTKCMIYCDYCDEHVCPNHFDEKKEKCMSCIRSSKKLKK